MNRVAKALEKMKAAGDLADLPGHCKLCGTKVETEDHPMHDPSGMEQPIYFCSADCLHEATHIFDDLTPSQALSAQMLRSAWLKRARRHRATRRGPVTTKRLTKKEREALEIVECLMKRVDVSELRVWRVPWFRATDGAEVQVSLTRRNDSVEHTGRTSAQAFEEMLGRPRIRRTG